MNRKTLLLVPFFTLAMALGAQVEVPLGEVPFILSDFFVLLSGLVLGRWWGLVSVAIYLLLGAFGLPVFAGGAGGIEHLSGATAGYLLGFLIAPFIVGTVVKRSPNKLLVNVLGVFSGQIGIFLLGLGWLWFGTTMNLTEVISVGLAPFWLAILLKMWAAGLLGWGIQKLKKN